MKIYVVERGIILSGKAWEVRQKLKEYRDQFTFLKDWIDFVNENQKNTPLFLNRKKDI